MKIKRIFSVLSLIFVIANLGLAQSNYHSKDVLIGVWVDFRSYGGAGDGNTYIFRKDGSFTFKYSQYNWAGRRIISFSGRFQLSTDSIFFRITETRELVGGHIDNDGPPLGLGWVIVDASEKVIKQRRSQSIGLDLSFKRRDEKDFILIDHNEYILVSRNPNEKR